MRKMTLAHGTDRLESARLVLRRIAPDDLPFFTRLHALPEVAQHLYPGGRPRSPEETAAWVQYTLGSYEQLALDYLAVLRKEDGALIGRCGLMDLVVESAAPEHGIRRGWFGRAQRSAAAGERALYDAPVSEPHIRKVRPDAPEVVWRVHVASSNGLPVRRGRPATRPADPPVASDARAGLASDPDGYFGAVEGGPI